MTRITMTAQVASLQQQIDAQKQQIFLLNNELTAERATKATVQLEHEKKLKDKESSYSYQSSNLTQAQNELEQAHAVLDGVEGAPTREYEKTDTYGGKGYRNVVTRLAGAFLAIAKNGGSK